MLGSQVRRGVLSAAEAGGLPPCTVQGTTVVSSWVLSFVSGMLDSGFSSGPLESTDFLC